MSLTHCMQHCHYCPFVTNSFMNNAIRPSHSSLKIRHEHQLHERNGKEAIRGHRVEKSLTLRSHVQLHVRR
jgi:hypothetical protein